MNVLVYRTLPSFYSTFLYQFENMNHNSEILQKKIYLRNLRTCINQNSVSTIQLQAGIIVHHTTFSYAEDLICEEPKRGNFCCLLPNTNNNAKMKETSKHMKLDPD